MKVRWNSDSSRRSHRTPFAQFQRAIAIELSENRAHLVDALLDYLAIEAASRAERVLLRVHRLDREVQVVVAWVNCVAAGIREHPGPVAAPLQLRPCSICDVDDGVERSARKMTPFHDAAPVATDTGQQSCAMNVERSTWRTRTQRRLLPGGRG